MTIRYIYIVFFIICIYIEKFQSDYFYFGSLGVLEVISFTFTSLTSVPCIVMMDLDLNLYLYGHVKCINYDLTVD